MKRDSRFELLRILSMFLIMLFHFEYFGETWRIDKANSLLDQIILSSYLPFGKIGVYLFIMITGYFVGIKSYRIKKSLTKAFIIWSETIFYSVTLFLIIVLLGLMNFSFKNFIAACLPFITNQYWFVSAYIMLLVLIPFINLAVENLGKKQFMYLIIITSFFGCFLTSINNSTFSSEISFGYIIPPYLIGTFIRKYGIQVSYVKIKITILYLVAVLLTALISYFGYGKYRSFFNFGILELLIATLVFVGFTKNRSFHNIGINTIAKTVFASYLITDNLYLKAAIWNFPLFHNSSVSPIWMNIIGFGVAVGLLIGSSIIDLLRDYLFNLLKFKSNRFLPKEK